MAEAEGSPALPPRREHVDARDVAWYVDRAVAALVFIGGVSAIVFVLSIFVFVAREGFGFIAERLQISEFFGSIAWRPTSNNPPTYGALALIAGTASVTALAMAADFSRLGF